MKNVSMMGRRGKGGRVVLSIITALIVGNGLGIKMFRSLAFCVILLHQVVPAYAQTIDIKRLAESIKLQENSYKHPYGILRSYCRPGDPDGQCRKGCIQTIEKRLAMWEKEGEPGDFISYLQKTYSPVGAKNDPGNLNQHWQKGVRYFYERQR